MLYLVETQTPEGVTWSWETQTANAAMMIFRAAFEEYGTACMYRLGEKGFEMIRKQLRTDTGFERIRKGVRK